MDLLGKFNMKLDVDEFDGLIDFCESNVLWIVYRNKLYEASIENVNFSRNMVFLKVEGLTGDVYPYIVLVITDLYLCINHEPDLKMYGAFTDKNGCIYLSVKDILIFKTDDHAVKCIEDRLTYHTHLTKLKKNE